MSAEASTNKPVSKSEWVMDFAAFAGTALCMYFLDWKAKDLLWGLWICSLTFGSAYFVVMLIAAILYQEGIGRIIVGVIGGVALYMGGFLFIMFHVGQAVFLHNWFVPLVGGDVEFDLNRESAWLALKVTSQNYWPLVVATFVSRYSDLPIKGIDVAQKEDAQRAMSKPFINVVRMHFLIIFLIFMKAADKMELAVYPVLLFYYFPWGRVFGRKKAAA